MTNILSAVLSALLTVSGMDMISDKAEARIQDTLAQNTVTALRSDTVVTVLSIDDAVRIALSENVSVKVADKEIQRTEYAKKGTYASLFPQIDGSAAFQRTIKKQVMYMDSDGGSSSMFLDALMPYFTQLYGFHGMPVPMPSGGDGNPESGSGGESSSSNSGFSVGRWNTWNAGITASMPLVNASLWESLRISGDAVELAVEKARGSRLAMVNQVKDAFYSVLWAKEANKVYEQIYANAQKNLEVTQVRYNSQKASEMELMRAKTTVANAIPDLYQSRTTVDLALWQLKAVMGVDLDFNIDCGGTLADYAQQMFYDIHSNDNPDLSRNTSLKQLDIQLQQLGHTLKLNKNAYIPSLALAFNYTYSAMANDFNFKEYKWTPYSYVGLSISIPIFSGGKRLNTVRQTKVQLEQLNLQRIQAERQTQIAIKSCLSTMENGMNSYYAAQSAVKSAEKAYVISEESYKVGKSTLLELNDAMLALAQAQLLQWQSVYSFLSAKTDLEEQLGKDIQSE